MKNYHQSSTGKSNELEALETAEFEDLMTMLDITTSKGEKQHRALVAGLNLTKEIKTNDRLPIALDIRRELFARSGVLSSEQPLANCFGQVKPGFKEEHFVAAELSCDFSERGRLERIKLLLEQLGAPDWPYSFEAAWTNWRRAHGIQ